MGNCENKSIVSFGAVTGNLPDLANTVADKLSMDQKYLFEICQAISVGKRFFELVNRRLSRANRLLRLYFCNLYLIT
ncbi:unnamed protein product [Ceratitis capitata]|uniref:(Mediterranean fruit fly) hypothetical protein n=1 Tax=Ceratitis capitata TaxID=7213 RepID=A0A811TZY9_CERCA|nr:unnamed protein product [Ceratitis capitata]